MIFQSRSLPPLSRSFSSALRPKNTRKCCFYKDMLHIPFFYWLFFTDKYSWFNIHINPVCQWILLKTMTHKTKSHLLNWNNREFYKFIFQTFAEIWMNILKSRDLPLHLHWSWCRTHKGLPALSHWLEGSTKNIKRK